jgi:hypothetical protein
MDSGLAAFAAPRNDRERSHPNKPGRVTIAGKPSDDMAPGTLNSALKQARLKEQK